VILIAIGQSGPQVKGAISRPASSRFDQRILDQLDGVARETVIWSPLSSSVHSQPPAWLSTDTSVAAVVLTDFK